MDPNLLVQATTSVPGQGLGTLEGIGKLGSPDLINEVTAAGTFANILSNIIGVMTIIAIIWFTFVLLTGAIGWLSSGGDKTKIENSQKQITNGIIGLVVVISAIFVIKLIGTLLGIPNILSIADFILKLTP
ncbi:MAG TPA: hypothetical protein VMW25_01955 [Clostridia bacterium]|nr:hypothetical protein [Clostridia bacterium]